MLKYKKTGKKKESTENDEQFPEETWRKSSERNIHFRLSRFDRRKAKKQTKKNKMSGKNKSKKYEGKKCDVGKTRKKFIEENVVQKTIHAINIETDCENSREDFEVSVSVVKGPELKVSENIEKEYECDKNKADNLVPEIFTKMNENATNVSKLSFPNIFITVDHYPKTFPEVNISIGGVNVKTEGMRTLNPFDEIDDSIINAFIYILITESQLQSIVLAFDTFFAYK